MHTVKVWRLTLEHGRLLGAAAEARKLILLQGTYRFGLPSADVTATLEGIDDLERLEEMSLRLLRVSSWPEVFVRSPIDARPAHLRSEDRCLRRDREDRSQQPGRQPPRGRRRVKPGGDVPS